MANENLKGIMAREWQKVRKRFHYPQLHQPELVDNIPNGSIDIKNLEIRVSEPFVQGFEQHRIGSEEVMNEVLTHELTHFMKYPGSVLNILRLQKSAQDLVDKHKVSELRVAFTEAQTNLYMTQELKHPSTAKIRKAYGLQKGDNFGKLMYGLYQEVSAQDFGVKLTRKEEGLVERLREIDFLDKEQEISSFRRFIEVTKDYQPPKQNQEGKGKNQESGQGKERSVNLCSGSGNSLDGFTENQIREGLKQFAQECSSPGEYEEIVRQVINEGAQKGGKGQEYETSSQKAGIGEGIAQLAGNFYTALAGKYQIPVRKKPIHKNGSLYPHSHTTFQVGDSITDVDAFSTPGILPGITKKWIRKEGEVYNSEESVPDSFIVLDTSSSMPDPCQEVSIPALGATVISNAYLDNGARVAVYIFSGVGNKILFGPSKNRGRVHQTLRTYFNGGTVFDSSALEEVLKHYKQPFDMSIVSDMEIANLDSFVSAILSVPQTHRIHLFWTNYSKMPYVEHLRQTFDRRENVAILPLTSDSDIRRITMGELKKSIN